MSQHYTDGVNTIEAIDFAVLSRKIVIDRSAVKDEINGIDSAELYDGMRAKKGGLLDERFGVVNNNGRCDTCGQQALTCPGHFGHIALAEPVFHIDLLRFLQKVLSMICLRCAKLRVNKTEKELSDMLKSNKTAKQRFAEIRNLTKNINYCQRPGVGCGTPAPKIKLVPKKTNTVELVAKTDMKHIASDESGSAVESRKEITQILTPHICRIILRNISDTDARIMGFEPSVYRPEDLIITDLPVPPVQVRPSIKMDIALSSTQEDQLTHKLAEIVKVNVRIRKYKDSNNEQYVKSISEHSHLLQINLATYINNETNLVPKQDHKSLVPTKSLAGRMKSKEGRIRGNLMGERLPETDGCVCSWGITIHGKHCKYPLARVYNHLVTCL
jgi:DNA-directed RNA polymerase II subunit RPB1